MRIIKQKAFQKKFIIVAFIATLVLCSYYFFILSPFQNTHTDSSSEITNSVDYGPATSEQRQAGYEAKKRFLTDETGSGDATQNAIGPTITITSVNKSESSVVLRTIVDTKVANGTCTLRMTSEGLSPIEQSVGLEDYGSYAVCKGFDVPLSSLAIGKWSATVTYINGATQSSQQRDIEI